ncbi:helix-turn-helix domain-containing protein [Enterococcus faecium]|uniref:helix-turn-helix domain-containing protein n=1 Tax=Enterococcus TaxID=1350 RepID=UPI001912A734|nr:helix-turn-helix domain-containing protein [Enterococcus faecium]MBK5028403.1 helix-turn-helix domain-containing protein [Enterococcus faecium]MBK5039043.1 helix-turn-helix domain-containing protein [Enterococcus faecium]MBK5044117.1 helix-turn-helix domain-containing protein [Enterococcus faecium]MBK5068898.1 helix-turn-helix domain-containing protein [Enterococcus faecium]MBK5132271.1 helix-turn-helix domain-containing protein [Enterococcus faecium]
MIEDYIEKDILRQVKIIEYFFDQEYISLKDLSENLDVTSETIRRDFSRIKTVLQEQIECIEIELSICHIQFLPEFTRYDLVKEIYQDSRFLRVCSRYIMGIKDYLSIVEEEFISVSKAFQLKKKVEAFFSQTICFADGGEDFDEFKKRFLILSIWMRCDLLDSMVNDRYWKLSQEFTDATLNNFSSHLNKREYIFFVKSVYLMLHYSPNSKLVIPKVAYDYMKTSVVVDKMDNLVRNFFELDILNGITKQEVIYLSIIFRMVPYNVQNYTLLKMDYEYQRQRLIEAFPDISQLIFSFEQEFKVPLLKNIRFEKPMLTFILSSLLETQNFVVDKHYFLSKDRKILKNRILDIFGRWNNFNIEKKYMFSPIALDRFCIEVSSMLVPQFIHYRFIVVVAENDDSHIEYRESISTYITGTDMILDNAMYYSLDELPEYYENYIIICERHLLNESKIFQNNLIFPISLSHLDTDLKNIFTKIYFDTKE